MLFFLVEQKYHVSCTMLTFFLFMQQSRFEGLLLRYETKLKHWTVMNIIGFIVIFIRRILQSQKC
jgi:hypothetical protein